MRISETKLVQLVESNPPQLVILNETDGSEIALIPIEVQRLAVAIAYFHNALFEDKGIPK